MEIKKICFVPHFCQHLPPPPPHLQKIHETYLIVPLPEVWHSIALPSGLDCGVPADVRAAAGPHILVTVLEAA